MIRFAPFLDQFLIFLFLLHLSLLQVRLVVKHVPNEELLAIPAAAEDLFIIGGRDAFEKRLQVSV